MALNTIADLSTTAGSNVDILGQNATGGGLANTIDTLLQNLMALMARAYGDQGGLGTVGGSANAITLTSLSTYQSLASGLTLAFKAASANTGATTLNLDGLGAKAVRRQGDSALSANDIVANGRYLIQYDAAYNGAAGAWVLINAEGYRAGGTDVAVADGGTNISSYTAGDLLYASGATTLSKLAKGSASQVLAMNAGATAPEWVTPVSGGMTLLGTLTTTSGTTQSLTGIAAGYRELHCELEGVSFTTSTNLTVALSSTNGAAYGTAVAALGSLSSAGNTLNGYIRISNISSTVAAAKVGFSVAREGGPTRGNTGFNLDTNTAAVVDAIQFGGGTFDAGTIRVYGVK